MALAVVLNVDRTDAARTGHDIPLVNLGRLPGADEVAATQAQDPGRARAPIPAGSRLRLPRLGLDAGITRVVAVDGVLQIPRDPHTVGWWTGGGAPGEAQGNTVIVGHVNYAGVNGAFFVLPNARPGDVIVMMEAGYQRRYRVVAIRSYPKSVGLPATVFSRTGPASLVLITCGGSFNRATGNYEDNIVAYAQPA